MASAAEQLAANINFSSFMKAEELKKRLLFTLGALIIYRLGTYIPLPGINIDQYAQAFQAGFGQGIGGLINMFAGGAVERMAIFALSIMPYISASIIMQLMTTVSPNLEKLKKEGEAGRKQINQYTRYLTVLLATVQAYAIANGIQGFAIHPGPFFVASVVITLVGGTMFLLWLGEQITSRGVGQGVSLIIMAGIVAEIPRTIAQFFELGRVGALPGFIIFAIALLLLGTLAFIVFMERAQRRLIVQYPKRQSGNRMMGGETSHLPLKINTAGVIPPIFASSLLLMPLTVISFMGQGSGPEWLSNIATFLGRGQPLYMGLYAAMIIFFAFFYTAIVFNPEDTADNLKKYGGFIPGIRPGKRTAEYIDFVLTRITVIGGLYLVGVCLIPEFLYGAYNISLAFGGTSLLIVVTVTMDTVAQIQSHLLAHQYEGLIKKSRLRGARR